MFDYSACDRCKYSPKYGSELCKAQWGDYCPAAQEYVQICYAEWVRMSKEDKVFWKEFFKKLGIDISYPM